MLLRAEWVRPKDVGLLLALLMPANRLVCRVSLACGLRVGDVVALHTADIANPRAWITESKTGKRRRLALGGELRREILAQAGPVWAFEGARDSARHRTRQAVWADLKRAARALRLEANVAPHSMRKCYAVDLMDRTGDLQQVQAALLHDDQATTLLYALADHFGPSGGSQKQQNREQKRREREKE